MAFDASQWMTPSGGYEIDNSLRMNGDADLDRTPDASNRRTYTLSAWVKRVGLSLSSTKVNLLDVYVDTNNFTRIGIESNDQFSILSRVGNQNKNLLQTSALLRDTSAWYHFVCAVDTTNGTANDRVKIYINGVEAEVGSRTNPDQNYDGHINAAVLHDIGKSTDMSMDAYIAEYNFIDGLALAPSAFGETGDYGEWKPIKYAGAYGNEGFYLDFKSSGVGTAGSGTVGADRSGNGNHYTSSNIAATDQMLDTPTNNFATWNPLTTGSYVTLSEGNLKVTGNTAADSGNTRSTMGMSTGLHYMEVYVGSGSYDGMGVSPIAYMDRPNNAAPQVGQVSAPGSVVYNANGTKVIDGQNASYGDSYANGSIIGIALDATNGAVYFSKNGVWQNSGDPTSGSSKTGAAETWTAPVEYVFATTEYNGSNITANFGQDSSFAGAKTAQGNQDGNGVGDFYYAPPTGFLALCTSNLPDVAVIPSEHFNTVLYTGDGQSTHAISGVGFRPDWLWIKNRGDAAGHTLQDVLRGPTATLYSQIPEGENATRAYVASFDSDGFTTGNASGAHKGPSNHDGDTYVAWNWKANGSGASNTDGSINTTKTSANVDAGYSIITYSGNNTAGATIGHGLSKAPEMVIIKSRTNGNDWWDTYHYDIGANNSLFLNTTNAALDRTYFHDTHPSSTLIYLGNDRSSNGPSENFVAYCFHSVDGYSAVGSYEGNGVADGSFVYTGFRPAFVLTKNADAADNWSIADTSRSPHNVAGESLRPDTTDVEDSAADIDILSNGFKVRQADSHRINYDAETFIYLAFAETPFKYSNAR